MVTGGIAPNPEGAVMRGAAGMFGPDDVAHHRHVTDMVHDAGGRIAMQILHAGRYGYNPDCVAPSAIKSPISPFAPRELDEAGIEKQIADIAAAAARAREAGYDGVEVMGSEGYFLNQFLVAHTNRRTDRWGGSYENRMRLPVEVVRRVRAAVGPDFIVIYRLSMIDLVPNGSSWDEVVTLARAVEAAGASLINTGIGWHEARVPTIATSVPRRAFAFVTAKLMGQVGVPLIASNRINTPDVAEEVLATGCADSQFVAKAAAGRSAEIAPCIACNQACLDHTFAGKVSSCLVNPRACHETELEIIPAAIPRRVAVVGAGAAGMAAAMTAAERGHAVTLFERADVVGGQLNLARQVPGKEEFHGLVDWFAGQLAATGVTLRLGHAAQPADLTGFDAVVIATGVRPRDPGIPVTGSAQVVGYADVLSGRVVAGARVAVVGAGGIGFDVAEYLVHAGDSPAEDVALWQAEWGVAEKPGKRLGKTTGWIHRASLKARGVRMLAGVQYTAITDAGLSITRDGLPELIPADTIVLCAGQESETTLAAQLAGTGAEVHVIGGADIAAELDAKRAIDAGVRLAARL